MSTLKELLAQREALDQQISQTKERERSEAVAKVKSLMSEYGLTIADLSSRAAKPAKVSKVAAKYRNQATGETWSGRGLQPKWLKAAIAGALMLASCGTDANTTSGAGTITPTGGGLTGTINAAGSSAQANAIAEWKKSFQAANPGVEINYQPSGSGAGIQAFIQGTVAFAGSDSALNDEKGEPAQADARCKTGKAINLPMVIGPVAVIYNLPGVDGLRLSPATLAGIFNSEITKWDAPEIKAENPGVSLPSIPIQAFHRSDESGTTENFQEYLAAAAGKDWPHEPSGDWPVPGGEAAGQTAGVVKAVQSGNGTIGYADASQVGDLATVKVGVGDDFVGYSPEAAAAVLDASERVKGRDDTSFAFDIARDTTKEGTYPIVLVSYLVACAEYDDKAKAELVKAYLSYVISEEGQQTAAKNAGSAPISDELRSQLQSAIDGISAS